MSISPVDHDEIIYKSLVHVTKTLNTLRFVKRALKHKEYKYNSKKYSTRVS